jgi:thioredoxin-related protein
MKHFRILHYLLKDKKNYHRDEELANQWDTYLYYLAQVRQLSWHLIKKKFVYFIKFKKIYLIKVLALFTILFFGLFFGGKYIIEHNSFFEVKRIVTSAPVDTFYCPDSIPVDSYIERTARIAGLSKDKVLKKVAFVMFYSEDTLKTADKWIKVLGQMESHNNPKAENGTRWGEWQMGQYERNSCGFGGVSKKEYLGSKDVQRANVIIYLKRNYRELKPYFNKYNNKIIRGYHFTLSGMLAMVHNCGGPQFIRFLNSGCTYIPMDGNMPSTNYLTIGNYNIKELLVD